VAVLIVQPSTPDRIDRYQEVAKVGAYGAPTLEGKFTFPISANGAYNYEARALEGKEEDYDLIFDFTGR
jgi:hypothetical protein